jgi:hypothetical protein
LIRGPLLVLLVSVLSCQWGGIRYPETPGTIFIRQQICDIDFFKQKFLLNPRNHLKDKGFTAYSLHRDLTDPKTYLIILRCQNLKKGVDFIQSAGLHAICVGAGLGLPLLWAGEDVKPREYENRPQMTGGIVIIRNQFKDGINGKSLADAEGKGGQEGLYRLLGNPGLLIVTDEFYDAAQIPNFVDSANLNGGVGAAGIIKREIWSGINLEEGLF